MIHIYIRDNRLMIEGAASKYSIPLTDGQNALYERARQDEIRAMEQSAAAQRQMPQS